MKTNVIGKQKLSVETVSSRGIFITEQVSNPPRLPYRAILIGDLTKKQALELGLLLIKAAQS